MAFIPATVISRYFNPERPIGILGSFIGTKFGNAVVLIIIFFAIQNVGFFIGRAIQKQQQKTL